MNQEFALRFAKPFLHLHFRGIVPRIKVGGYNCTSIRLNHSFEFCQLADLRASLCFIKNTNTNIDAHTITSLCVYQAYPKVSVGYCREGENTRQTIKRVQWGGDTVCMEIEIKIQVQIRVVIV